MLQLNPSYDQLYALNFGLQQPQRILSALLLLL
jgi:hypothetical protein